MYLFCVLAIAFKQYYIIKKCERDFGIIVISKYVFCGDHLSGFSCYFYFQILLYMMMHAILKNMDAIQLEAN